MRGCATIHEYIGARAFNFFFETVCKHYHIVHVIAFLLFSPRSGVDNPIGCAFALVHVENVALIPMDRSP